METLTKIFGVLGILLILLFIATYPVMLLWNWLVPDIFGLIEISFWQTLGLLLLSAAFFKTSIKH